MLSIKDAYIDVHLSETGAGVDFTIPGGDIERIEHSRRINRRKDEGEIVLHNHDGSYSTDDTQITLGDRLDVYVAPEGAPTAWGRGGWGYGGWGGHRLLWSAIVQDPTYRRESAARSFLDLECTDFVFGILAERTVFDSFDQVPISGSDDAILNQVVRREAPAIDLRHVADVGETTSVTAGGTDLLEFVIKLARRCDAVMYGYRDRLVFDRVDTIAREFVVDPDTDIGPVEVPFKGGSVKNEIRVDGSTDHRPYSKATQTTQDGYTTVTQDARATVAVELPKSRMERLELWTNPTDSRESITVRLQADDGGAPVDATDTELDIDSTQLSHEFLAADGFTDFVLNDHTLPDAANTWVIVETDGPDGQAIGIDTATGTPAYKAHYPFPVTTQVLDTDSIGQYRKREQNISQDNLDTLDAAQELAGEALAHRAEPEHEVNTDAVSRRAHRLDPGEVIAFGGEQGGQSGLDRERVNGDYMITELTETLDGVTLTASLSAQETSNI